MSDPVSDGERPDAIPADRPADAETARLFLVGAHLLEQTAPDRYQFHDLLRAYATDQAQTEEPAEKRKAALCRVLDWYLHTADAAQGWIKPGEQRLSPAASTTEVPPLEFADYNAAVDWSEREHATFPHLVRAATLAGLDVRAWQLAAVLWSARFPSSPAGDWIAMGRSGLEAAERSGDAAAQVRLLTSLGMAYRSANNLDAGLDCHQRALALARTSARRFDEARSLNLIGLIHLDSRRLDLADDHFAQAETISREQDEPQRAAMALSNVASTRLEAGRLPEAAAAAGQALAAHRALNSPQSVGNILYVAAEVHREQGEIEQARRSIDEALDIALILRNRRLEGFWLIILGNVQQAAGEFGDALASYQRSAMLHRRLGDRSREALAWRGAGETYVRLDRHDEAVAFHRQAVAAHRELGDTWNQAVELDCLAAALVPEDLAAARRHWAEALTHLTAYDDPRAVATRDRIAQRLAETEN